MDSRIETLTEKKLVGKRLKMSFADNKTGELWQNFIPERKEIQNNISNDLYSMQIYPPLFFRNFNPTVEFEKWAAVEVTGFEHVPAEMETFILQNGLYAVFLYQGSSGEAAKVFQYILGVLLPNSEFELDDRPHFEVLGEKYKNDDPNSEEEIWIPVKLKS